MPAGFVLAWVGAEEELSGKIPIISGMVTTGELEPKWFFSAFIGFCLLISALLSLMGGWHELALRFRSDNPVDGERFRFRSGSLGHGLFPVSYGGCLFATVGAAEFALSVLFPFRFMHPRLVIPWSAVESCERVSFWFMDHVEVRISGFSRRLRLRGALGEKVFAAWNEFHAKS